MPFIQRVLLYVPIVPLGAIIISMAVAISVVGLSIVWRFVPRQMLKDHNDLTGSMFEAIAMAYTVLLAFVVVISWQNFDKAESHVETEANCLVDLYRASPAFGQPFQGNAQSLIKEYSNVVVNEEWPALARGEESIKARDILRKLWTVFTDYEPKTKKEEIFFAESVRKLDDLREMRRLRIIDSRTGVHQVLWFVLVAGAIATIGFTFFFGSDKFITHAIMASVLSVVIALILLTILSFSFPFTGSVCIEPQTFQQIIGF